MIFGAICERKRPRKFMVIVFLIIGLVIPLFLDSKSDIRGDEPSAKTFILETGAWHELGLGSASGLGLSADIEPSEPSLAIGPDGTPIIAWTSTVLKNNRYISEIFVRQWNGVDWVEVGSGSASGGGISNSQDSRSPSLAINYDGMPIVAWKDGPWDDFHPANIFLRGWNGAAWPEMGPGSASGKGLSNTETQSWEPTLAIGSDNQPIVAWSDSQHEYEQLDSSIYVRRWDGSDWLEVGTGSSSGAGISGNQDARQPSLVIAPNGSPIVVWSDYSIPASPKIFVRRWDGVAWIDMNSSSASGGGVSDASGRHPAIIVGPDNRPIVAWEASSHIYLLRWDGEDWIEMGPGSASGDGISNDSSFPYHARSEDPTLAISPDGHPIIAWTQILHKHPRSCHFYEIQVRYWDGEDWVDLDSHFFDAPEDVWFKSPSLKIGFDGIPVISWEAFHPWCGIGGPEHIYGLRWHPHVIFAPGVFRK